MERELKACPFCGSEEIYMKYNGGRFGDFYYAECAICGSRTRGVCRPYKELPIADEEDKHEWDNNAANAVRVLWNQRTDVHHREGK